MSQFPQNDPGAASSESGQNFRLAASTFGFLYRESLGDALTKVAAAGYSEVEIAPVPPHIASHGWKEGEVSLLKAQLDDLGLACVSLNPPELNLISPNDDIRMLARRHYVSSVRLAERLGAKVVVVVPGRQNLLIPRPESEGVRVLREQIISLLDETDDSEVCIAVETAPFGFLGTATAVSKVVHGIDSSRVGVTLDFANIFGKEEFSTAVTVAGERLRMVHISDTWLTRFSHTSIHRGEVDFSEVLSLLQGAGYAGPCVYELVDGDDPGPRIGDDLRVLSGEGWPR